MGRFVFKLPDVGEGTAEAEVVTWHVKAGDTVAEDQPLADVMTDKATVELTSPVAGTVVSTHGEIGAMSAVGSPLVVLEVEGAGNTAADYVAPAAAAAAPAKAEAAPEPKVQAAPDTAHPTETAAADAAPSGGGNYAFKLPDVGEGTAEAELVAWHVKAGDTVAEDQPLAEVMTDKATVELTSPVAGTVVSTHGDVGAMAAVGSVLVRLQVEGAGNVKGGAAAPAAKAAAPALQPKAEAKPAAPAAKPASTPAPSKAAPAAQPRPARPRNPRSPRGRRARGRWLRRR